MAQEQHPIICPRCHAESFDNSWKCWRCGKRFPYALRFRARANQGEAQRSRSGCLALLGRAFLAFVALLTLVVVLGQARLAMMTPDERAEFDRKQAQKAVEREASRMAEAETKRKAQQATAALDSEREAARQAVLGKVKAEPVVKDAIWTSDRMLKLGVLDDGTPRDGLAMYGCGIVSDFPELKGGVSVQVIDIIKLTRDSKWIKLGESRCR
ncbi:hypothetical protein [Thiorhodococcus fuscus]|uniref:Pilus assembly protein PilP n=1 Tax=Thiorhodococcus fuscus TaxID=527200 RepID=A0ABW4Y8V6_9GAMM